MKKTRVFKPIPILTGIAVLVVLLAASAPAFAVADEVAIYNDSDALQIASFVGPGDTIWVKIFVSSLGSVADSAAVDTFSASTGDADTFKITVFDTTTLSSIFSGDTAPSDSIFSAFIFVSQSGPSGLNQAVMRTGDTLVVFSDLDDAGDTGVSNVVTADFTPPTAPTLLALSDTFGPGIDISWGAAQDTMSGVSRYHIQVDTDPDFGNPFADSIVYSSGTTLFVQLTEDTWFVRVRAEDTVGNLGAWSDTLTTDTMVFVDRTPPTAPVLFTVSDTGVDSFTIRWVESLDTVSRVRTYEVQLDTDPNFANTYLHTTVPGSDTQITYIFPESDTWYVRVRAVDTVGIPGAFSDTLNFDTEFVVDFTAPSTPTLIATADTSETFITIFWAASLDPVSGVETYSIQISTDPNFSPGTLVEDSQAVSNQVTAFQVTQIDTAGTYYVRVRAADTFQNVSGYSQDTFVVKRILGALDVSAPSPDSATVGFLLSITALDQFGDRFGNYETTLILTSTDTSIQPGTAVIGPGGTVTLGVTLSAVGSQTITVSDGAVSGTVSKTVQVVIQPGPLDRFLIVPDTTLVTSGEGFIVTMTALDLPGNLTSDSAVGDSIRFEISGVGIVDPDSVTFTDSVIRLNVTVTAVGNVTLTVRNGTVTGTTVISLFPGRVDRFIIGTPSTAVSVGVSFNIGITALDRAGTTTFQFDNHTVTFQVSGGTVLPTVSPIFSNGVTQLNVSVTATGNLVLTAVDTGGHSGTLAFTSTPGPWRNFVVSVPATSVSAAVGFTLTVTALDFGGNVSPDSDGISGTVSVDAGQVIPSVTAAFNNGVSQTSVSLSAPGTVVITVSTGAVSGTVDVLVTPGPTDTFILQVAPTNISAGVPFTVIITAQDQFGNITADSRGFQPFLEINTGSITPNQSNAFTAAGVSEVNVTVTKAGQLLLSVKDALVSPRILSTVTINPSFGPPTSFVITPPAGTVEAGDSFMIEITALDIGGQVAQGSTLPVTITPDAGFVVTPNQLSSWNNGLLVDTVIVKTTIDISGPTALTLTFTDGEKSGTAAMLIRDTVKPVLQAFSISSGTFVISETFVIDNIVAVDTGDYGDTPVQMALDIQFPVIAAPQTFEKQTQFALSNQSDSAYLIWINLLDHSNNQSNLFPDSMLVILDRKNPQGLLGGPPDQATVVINSAADSTTSRNLTLKTKARGATFFRVSESLSDFADSTVNWQPFPFGSATQSETDIPFTLTSAGDGEKKVYIQLRDDVDPNAFTGNIITISDTINLDEKIPDKPEVRIQFETTILNREYVPQQTVIVEVIYDTTIDTDIARVVISGDIVGGDVVGVPPDTEFAITLTSGDGEKTVYAIVEDSAGLQSDTGIDTVVLDTILPLGPPIPKVWIAGDTVIQGETYILDTAIRIHFDVETGTTNGIFIRFGQNEINPGGGVFGPDEFTNSAFQAYFDSADYSILIAPAQVDENPKGISVNIRFQYRDAVETSAVDSITLILNNKPPSAVSNLISTVNQQGTVTLTWTAAVAPDTIFYRIYSDTGGFNFDGTPGNVNFDSPVGFTSQTSFQVPFAFNFAESFTFAVTAVDYLGNETGGVFIVIGDTFLPGDLDDDNDVDEDDLRKLLQFFGMKRVDNVTEWENFVKTVDIFKKRAFQNGIVIDSTDKIDIWDVRELMLRFNYGKK